MPEAHALTEYGMEAGQPSRTAMAAAMHRAAHQKIEGGATFSDPYALRIIGRDARKKLDQWAAALQRRPLRFFIAARHRFADEKLALAARRGTRQAVIVGAGLDTTALRGVEDVQYFEVDHPATQAWKRLRLAEEGLEPPDELVFAPVDFERQSLGDGLAAAGFDATRPTIFIWLGVVPYLTDGAIAATLDFIASVPSAEVVFDYANPPDQLDPKLQQRHAKRAERVAALGEAWLSYFDSAELEARLRGLGAVEIEDLGPLEIQRYIFGIPEPRYSGAGGHILWARWG
jgi:methyltransferase (TIGR00027 family)